MCSQTTQALRREAGGGLAGGSRQSRCGEVWQIRWQTALCFVFSLDAPRATKGGDKEFRSRVSAPLPCPRLRRTPTWRPPDATRFWSCKPARRRSGRMRKPSRLARRGTVRTRSTVFQQIYAVGDRTQNDFCTRPKSRHTRLCRLPLRVIRELT